MWRIAWAAVLVSMFAGCASHRPVKVSCSGHLVRINAMAPVAEKTSGAPDSTPAAPADASSPARDEDAQ